MTRQVTCSALTSEVDIFNHRRSSSFRYFGRNPFGLGDIGLFHQFQADEELQTQLGVGRSFLEETVRKEIIQLARNGCLGASYDVDALDRVYELKRRDIIENFEQIAPTLVQLLRRVCEPLHASEPSETELNRACHVLFIPNTKAEELITGAW